MCKTKPNITFAIGQLSKYNSDSKTVYKKVVKKVIYYLKNIMHLGFVYRTYAKNKGETKTLIIFFLLRLIRYIDNNIISLSQ